MSGKVIRISDYTVMAKIDCHEHGYVLVVCNNSTHFIVATVLAPEVESEFAEAVAGYKYSDRENATAVPYMFALMAAVEEALKR